MPAAKNFIFYDRKKNRWLKIQKGLQKLIIFLEIFAIFLLLSVFSIPRFDSQIIEKFDKSTTELIDDISIKEEETIDVIGKGPLVELQLSDNDTNLIRKDFKEERTVILSFDDGPDSTFTPKILDVLKKEGVGAVFFVVGEQLFKHPEIAKRIIDEGHQIGIHTFSHTPEETSLYNNKEQVRFEVDFPQKILLARTGHKTRLFRVPYWGAEETISLNSLVLTIYALDRGYKVVSSTVDSFDWKETDKDAVVQNSVDLSSSQIILLHDGGGDRAVTVEALPKIIKKYKEAGFSFKTVDEQNTVYPITYLERSAAFASYSLYFLFRNFNLILDGLFALSLLLILTSITVILCLSFCQIAKKRAKKNNNFFTPFVSVLVPAFNEERTIAKTIQSLLSSDYPNFEIIVINNNSKDKTSSVVRAWKSTGFVKLVNEKKQGKFAALNRGVRLAKARILVVIDADTQVLANTLFELVQPLRELKVGAVAGNLKVGNLVNPLTFLQAIEYIVGLNLDRRAYDLLSAIPVVPGALGAWRKSAIKKVGGYKNDTLTEDADLTLRVQRAGFKVVFAGDSVAFTEAPQNLKAYLRQRFRWTLGILQVLFKHKDIFFKRRYGILGTIILPYLALVQLPFMLFSPIVDILALVFFVISPLPILTYFSLFLVLNYTLAFVAFVFAKEGKLWLLLFLPLGRVYYQLIWYYTLYRSVITALKGIYVPWKKLSHLGTVSIEEDEKEFIIAPELKPISQR